MRRRHVLHGIIAILTGASGCTSGDGTSPTKTTTEASSPTETTTGTQTTTAPSSDSEENIQIIFNNSTSGDVVVNLEISRESVILSDQVTVRSDSRTEIKSKITETGQYQIEISVDNGIEESYSWNVGDYDLRMGSNVIISITQNGLTMLVEE